MGSLLRQRMIDDLCIRNYSPRTIETYIRSVLIPVIASTLVVIATAVFAFTFVTIDVPGATSTQFHGINPQGDIVGQYTSGGTDHGFLLHQGTFTTIDVPGAMGTEPRCINSEGDIVGSYEVGQVGPPAMAFSSGRAPSLPSTHQAPQTPWPSASTRRVTSSAATSPGALTMGSWQNSVRRGERSVVLDTGSLPSWGLNVTRSRVAQTNSS